MAKVLKFHGVQVPTNLPTPGTAWLYHCLQAAILQIFLNISSSQFICESTFFRFKGTYRSQEVAIKILKPESVNTDMLQEFSQEVYIMRFATS